MAAKEEVSQNPWLIPLESDSEESNRSYNSIDLKSTIIPSLILYCKMDGKNEDCSIRNVIQLFKLWNYFLHVKRYYYNQKPKYEK